MKKLCQIIMTALGMLFIFSFNEWYSLTYRTKMNTPVQGAKPQAAYFYEDLFSRLLFFLAVSFTIYLIAFLIKKINSKMKNKNE